MADEQDDITDGLMAMSGHARKGAFRAIWDHYPEFAAAKGKRPSWKAMAEWLSERGVRSRGNKTLTGEAVRKAFLRVEKERNRTPGPPTGESVSQERSGGRGGQLRTETPPAGGKPAHEPPTRDWRDLIED